MDGDGWAANVQRVCIIELCCTPSNLKQLSKNIRAVAFPSIFDVVLHRMRQTILRIRAIRDQRISQNQFEDVKTVVNDDSKLRNIPAIRASAGWKLRMLHCEMYINILHPAVEFALE